MSNAQPANAPVDTMSEKELWAMFVSHSWQQTLSMGPTVETTAPNALLRIEGLYGDLEDFSNHVADEIDTSEHPRRTLREIIGEVEDYLRNLKEVGRVIDEVASSLRIHEDDEDAEPRYRRPDGETGFIARKSAQETAE